MGVQVIDVARRIDADRFAVWALLDDSASWPSWTRIDAHEPVAPGGPDGIGEVRVFRTGRHVIRERIVERHPGQRLTYTVLAGLAVKDYRAQITVSAAGPNATDLRWHTTFRPKVPGTGRLYLRALRSATEAFVDGLAHASETSPRPSPGAAADSAGSSA